MTRLLVVGVVVGVLALVGCGDDDSDAGGDDDGGGAVGTATTSTESEAAAGGDEQPVSDPAELAQRLRDAGLGCDDYEEVDPGEGPGYPERQGGCTLSNGTEVGIDVLTDETAWDEYIVAGQAACGWTGGHEFLYAAGPWWSIAADGEMGEDGSLVVDNETTEAVADALGAELESLGC